MLWGKAKFGPVPASLDIFSTFYCTKHLIVALTESKSPCPNLFQNSTLSLVCARKGRGAQLDPSRWQVDKGALWHFQLFNTGRNRESALWSYFLQNVSDPVQVPLLRFFCRFCLCCNGVNNNGSQWSWGEQRRRIWQGSTPLSGQRPDLSIVFLSYRFAYLNIWQGSTLWSRLA